MNKDEIKKVLPHRDPMLLIDEVHMEGEISIAHKHINGDEFFLQGHFPGYPVVPGVILCEIMAQSCALLLGDLGGKTALYRSIDNAKFKHIVRPGDDIEIKCRITAQRGPVVFTEAQAHVGEHLCCSAKMSFALVDLNV